MFRVADCRMQTRSSGPTLRSGELARLTGVSRDTLRLYERRRLLPVQSRSASGYRLYGPAAAHRVRLIRAALSIGFTIEECLQDRNRGIHSGSHSLTRFSKAIRRQNGGLPDACG